LFCRYNAHKVQHTRALLTACRCLQDAENLIDSITVPASLITRELGARIKEALAAAAAPDADAQAVVAEMDWSDTIPDASPAVVWSLWGTSSMACGAVCDRLARFLHDFAPIAATLAAPSSSAAGSNVTAVAFEPHFSSWRCDSNAAGNACATQCINNGRYAAFCTCFVCCSRLLALCCSIMSLR
jgi:hypothetical protein